MLNITFLFFVKLHYYTNSSGHYIIRLNSVHGFPIGFIQCELKLLGIAGERRGSNVGTLPDQYLASACKEA